MIIQIIIKRKNLNHYMAIILTKKKVQIYTTRIQNSINNNSNNNNTFNNTTNKSTMNNMPCIT